MPLITTIYAPDDIVKSADLNTLIARHNDGLSEALKVDVLAFVNLENFTYSANFEPTTTLAGAEAAIALTLPEGWTLTGLSAHATDTGAGDPGFVELWERPGSGSIAPVAGAKVDNFGSPGTIQPAAFTELIAADTSYFFVFATPGTWTPGVFTVHQAKLLISPST